MNIKQLLEKGINILKENNVENPIQHSRILLSYVMNKTKEYIVVHDNESVNKNIEEEYKKCISELISGMPLQYIINVQEFMKLDFFVNESVLIPRADTEILVEEVIRIAKRENKLKILDLCTGSGAIGISLSKYIENAEIICTDISQKAIEVANKNKKIHKAEIEILQSNMFENIKNKFDIIVSNPPYISEKVMHTLGKRVLSEPHIALNGGESGLEFYEIIAENGYKFLNEQGYICVEIGYDQRKSVTEIFKRYKQYGEIYSKKDFNGLDRIVVVKKG